MKDSINSFEQRMWNIHVKLYESHKTLLKTVTPNSVIANKLIQTIEELEIKYPKLKDKFV